MKIIQSLMCALFLVVAGCGYTTGSLLPSNYRHIHIEDFSNKVAYLNEQVRALYVPLLEVKLHDAIVSQFQSDGHLKVTSSSNADLVLKGELTGFEREELRVSRENNIDVQEYRLRITIAMKLFDPAAQEEQWSETSFSGEATYHVTGPQAKSESQALQDCLTDLSRRVVERVQENW